MKGPRGGLISLLGFIGYSLVLVIAYRWSIAKGEGKVNALRRLWMLASLMAFVSVCLIVFSLQWLQSICTLCLLNSLVAVFVLAVVNGLRERQQTVYLPLNLRNLLVATLLLVGTSMYAGTRIKWISPNWGIVRADTVPEDRLLSSHRPSYGSIAAPTTVVVYSDPVCPACMYYVPILVAEAEGRLLNRIRIVYHQFPLTRIHPQAQDLSILECWASENGKFDQLRRLIDDQQGSKNRIFQNLADLGLSKSRAEQMLSAEKAHPGRLSKMIASDVADATALGLTGTPYFVIVRKGEPTRWFLGGAIVDWLKSM